MNAVIAVFLTRANFCYSQGSDMSKQVINFIDALLISFVELLSQIIPNFYRL